MPDKKNRTKPGRPGSAPPARHNGREADVLMVSCDRLRPGGSPTRWPDWQKYWPGQNAFSRDNLSTLPRYQRPALLPLCRIAYGGAILGRSPLRTD